MLNSLNELKKLSEDNGSASMGTLIRSGRSIRKFMDLENLLQWLVERPSEIFAWMGAWGCFPVGEFV